METWVFNFQQYVRISLFTGPKKKQKLGNKPEDKKRKT